MAVDPDVLALFAALDTLPDVGVRYVAVSGDDLNDGLSWATAKRTGYAAVTALPTKTADGADSHIGKVCFGGGRFDETQTWPINTGLTLEGVGPAIWYGGTEIVRQHEGPMIAPDDTFGGYAHSVIISRMAFDGNNVWQSGIADLIVLRRGGVNTRLSDVLLRSATGAGLSVGSPLNLQFDNVCASRCDGGALRIESAGNPSLSSFVWYGGQVDNCGPHAVTIDDQTTSVLPDNATFSFRDLKFESEDDTHHLSCIRLVPDSSRSPIIRVDNVQRSTVYPPPTTPTSLCLEADGSGLAGRWLIGPATVDNAYAEIFRSDKKNTDSGGRATIITPEEF